ncbi:hypothetical protein FE810_15430 [Thalassotalea litorea]|uniref:Uncharacterized protein n=1 Tax=Thalassotalea litorea TaxID=2020715 RepID=A0A5R9IIS8_9GAMM|nr:hypothetical protein [Thalassotalea litorea]TLU61212.1 hypothetical protein FE810_15430 [Thalassotalea litorea]
MNKTETKLNANSLVQDIERLQALRRCGALTKDDLEAEIRLLHLKMAAHERLALEDKITHLTQLLEGHHDGK